MTYLSFSPLLGQIVNVGLGPAGILGIGLAVAGALLYFLRSVQPELARDHDIFFAAVALLCGGILFFQGWRLDPILLFGQFLLTGTAAFFAYESIRLRRVATEQARRNTPIVDEERPVSRSYTYRAELEELEPYEDEEEEEEDYPPLRRIRGSREVSRSRYEDEDVEDTPPVGRLPSRRSSPPPSRPSVRRPPSRRPRPTPPPADEIVDEPYRPPTPTTRRPTRRPPPPITETAEVSDRPVRRRPPRPRPEGTTDGSEYVPYQPLDRPPTDEQDNSANFDE
ncbi:MULTISPECIES: Ycf66 family protein [unclassified Thermosynechococcus]|uniref:Ycf66 family protein n=1 Tax=unclassified Thermosynechococcus TaxID=2622553 RepID=UPI002872CC4B|nr:MULTISPECIES: Ycf66 family protein [unclassified Thermosynechococcus]WNC31350.1 Ycf66 family protein [Thermosynechococcus sp. PKX95]WNC33874.1 Ycf66 family protein [Thermosynechococcus sp. PKX91]WNC36398.1 Ycf66 family protein [Thermosynechococcus sp. WL11]WNC38919.1 Ycf66 family protein [Thermosynechococcus sp. WL17]WNC41441.1 Ycf66 family protein [Thermosynechococcus sp. WL15]